MALRTINGIQVGDYVPLPEFQPCSGTAIVLGNAPNFKDEYDAARNICPEAKVYGVNRSAWEIVCDYWVTVHPEMVFIKDRWAVRMSDRLGDNIDMAFPIATRGGSSALLATLIALVMGHDMVITAGVHLIGAYKTMQNRWYWYADQLGGRVKSVSPEGTFIRDKFGGCYGH